MYPGTLNYHQGVDIAISAFGMVRELIPLAEFHIYGDGPERSNLCALVSCLGLQGRVVLHRFMSITEISKIMSQADVGIIPKRNDSFGDEAFSTKSFEFMAVGVPLIMSETTIDKYYFNSSVVEFFKPNDKIDLSSKMLMLYNNPERRRLLKERSREFVAINDWSHKKKEYLDLLDKLVHQQEQKIRKSDSRLMKKFSAMKGWKMLRGLYFFMKPIIPRFLQIFLRRRLASWQIKNVGSCWPINTAFAKKPVNWTGWPSGKRFAFILTHDVESARGLDRVLGLASMEREIGFRSSFNFVPGKYAITRRLGKQLGEYGFEIGVHDLRHDGRLYFSKRSFERKAAQINSYLKEWSAVGFRSAYMLHKLEWLHKLNIDYDLSTFDTDPFEPQSDGLGTIFPVWIAEKGQENGYVEIPYTLPQDLTIFILLKETDTRIWNEKLDWLARKGGMALLNTHPDYMYWGVGEPRIDEYSNEYYACFLNYVKRKYEGQYWNALPREVAGYWKNMTYVKGE
jgi:hypothetical protein